MGGGASKPSAEARMCTEYERGMEGEFFCDGKCESFGTVWGSKEGHYLPDSCACRAARHAGAISEKGGAFLVRKTEGKDQYEGVEANGVVSASYGKNVTSIEICAKKN